MLHVLGDLLGSGAAVVAALVILATGWTPIDPIASVLVAVIILRSAWRVVSEAGHILLEGTPPEIDTRAIAADLVASIPAVEDVHHVHVWSLTQERRMATLHARLVAGADPDEAVRSIKRRLGTDLRPRSCDRRDRTRRLRDAADEAKEDAAGGA